MEMETVIHLKISLTTMIAPFWIAEVHLGLEVHQAMVLVAEANLLINVLSFASALNIMVKNGKILLFVYFQKQFMNTWQLVLPKVHVLVLRFVNQSKVHITNEMVLWKTKPFACLQKHYYNISEKALEKDPVLLRNVRSHAMMYVLLLVATLPDHLEKMVEMVWTEKMVLTATVLKNVQ